MNKKGFTLAELLIVVAIIAVLVAIAIPIFSSQLEKAREATDAANIRSKYAEMMTNVIANENDSTTYTVSLKQQQDDWQNKFDFPATEIGVPKKGGTATLEFKENIAYINYGNGNSSDNKDSGTTNDVKNKAVTYPTTISDKQRTSQGTLYEYNGSYFIATKNGEWAEVPKDSKHGLYQVNINVVHTVESKTDEALSNITNISKGDIIYVSDTKTYYVFYDTNGKVKATSDLQEIK